MEFYSQKEGRVAKLPSLLFANKIETTFSKLRICVATATQTLVKRFDYYQQLNYAPWKSAGNDCWMLDPIPCECAAVATNVKKPYKLQLLRKEWKKFIRLFYVLFMFINLKKFR
jgi:hypothetical protein